MAKEGKLRKGKRQKKTHGKCRRCGEHAFHLSRGICAKCGFGNSSRIKKYNWQKRTRTGEKKV